MTTRSRQLCLQPRKLRCGGLRLQEATSSVAAPAFKGF